MNYKLKGTVTSAIFVVSVLLIISFFVLTPVFSTIILSAVVAYGIRLISKKMLPYLKYETLSILVSMAMVILPLIVLIIIIVNSLIESTPLIVGIVKSANLGSINASTIQQYPLVQQYMPAGFQAYMDSFLNAVNVGLGDILRNILNYLIEKLGSVPTLLFELFIFFASTFYIAKDGDKLWDYITYAIPSDREHYFNTLFKEVERVLKSIFVGHFLTGIITGVLAGIGFAIIGYPFATFLGILTGFFQLIPFIGHWPLPIILAVYGFLTGSYIQAVAVLALGLLMSIVDFFLRPKLSSKYADIHPLIFILGFLCGPLVFGLVGFVLGPLILGVTYAAVISFKKERIGESAEIIKDDTKNGSANKKLNDLNNK
jgi:predicted PurR-regulated permease PerM